MDWSLGRYERTAEQLRPAAGVVVDACGPLQGASVLDLGCGSGNAALIAAERGGRVTGVDPAERLLEVARAQALAEGLNARFLAGEAASIPLEDGSVDLLISVFGVIFAPDAQAAAAEMARVTAADGRMVLSAWIPEGAIAESARIGREAVARALGAPPPSPGFAWHDLDTLTELLEPHGFSLSLATHPLAFTASSPRAWVEDEARDHPLRVAGAAVLEQRGEAQAVLDRTLEVFEAANEDPDAFKVTSRYVVATATR
jgi:SAM-dependent methyltransferase